MTIDSWNAVPASGEAPWVIVSAAEMPGYAFRLTFDMELNLTELAINAVGAPLTSRAVRKVQVGALETAARSRIISWWSAYEATRSAAGREFRPTPTAWLDLARPGRRGRQDLEYAQVAELYVTLIGRGDRTPLATLAAQLNLSPSQVRNVLYEARRRELLSDPPHSGIAGGSLTPKARGMLGSVERTAPVQPAPNAWAIATHERMRKLIEAGDTVGYLAAVEELTAELEDKEH